MSQVKEKVEPEECPVCGTSFFTGTCRGCGFDATEADIH